MKKTAIILFLMEPIFLVLLQCLKGLEIMYSFLGIFESSLFYCKFMDAKLSLEACPNVHIQNGELSLEELLCCIFVLSTFLISCFA